jgi:Histidine kinase-like ATPase domain
MTTVVTRPRYWRWPAEPGTARRARRAAERTLAAWQLERLADDLDLILSELVTNAYRYGGGPVTVVLRRTPSGVRGEVGDSLAVWPLRAELPRRHGLRIVLSLSRAVWVSPRPGGGKRVCFDLDDRAR